MGIEKRYRINESRDQPDHSPDQYVLPSYWNSEPSNRCCSKVCFVPGPCNGLNTTISYSLTPAIYDPKAPDAQAICPGYQASNFVNTTQGFTADLTIAGEDCSAYGNDIVDLTLVVEYQTQSRLSVKIYPKDLVPQNSSLYILPAYLTPLPSADGSTTATSSDLRFEWSNEPSFQFQISRASSEEVIFSTYGHKLVFEDQFLELKTNMVNNYNVYGLAENIHDFRLGNNYTQVSSFISRQCERCDCDDDVDFLCGRQRQSCGWQSLWYSPNVPRNQVQ